LPRAFGPTASSSPDGDAVQVVDNVVGVVAELHQGDTDDGSGAASAAHAMHCNADAPLQMVSHVGGSRDNEIAFSFFIVGVAAADEVLKAH
jgi:hypothetical protein